MNYRMIIHLLGIILAIEAALMLLPMLTAAIFGESVLPFLFAILIIAAVATPAVMLRPKNTRIFIKEGFVTVASVWILLSVFGSLPFVFSRAAGFVDSIFETVSGFTTTGASVLSDLESIGKGLLLWRSLTHWIGGMGVLVFVLAFLPMAGGQSIYLMRAEVPGPTKGKLVPKMRQTSLILYGIYIALTLLEIIALLISGMPLFDSIVNSFSNAGTGGFAPLTDSIAGYNNPAAEWIITVFMVLFGINFNLYFFVIIGHIGSALKSEELRIYLGIYLVSSALIATNIASQFESVGTAIRTAFFNVASVMSTTGFVTAEFNAFPEFSKTLLIILMLIGASAGSTAGGLKVARVVILLKSMVRELRHTLRPRSVNTVKLDGEAIPDEAVRAAGVYFGIYAAIIALTTLIISLDGFSFETNFTAALTAINNVGFVFGEVGAFGSLAGYSALSKITLSVVMLIGRLEIMPMLIFLSPRTWRRG